MTIPNHLINSPKIHTISEVLVPRIDQYFSSNNVPVVEITKKDCGVVSVELVFRAGRPQEHKRLSSFACSGMMREGAGPFNAQELSEEIDFLGATLAVRSSLDFISVKSVFLRKHLKSMFEILSFILSEPRFHHEDWEYFIEKGKERLTLQTAKNDILSYRKITEEMYGEYHPYGYNSSVALYDELSIDDLFIHHQSFITAENCQLFLAGEILPSDRDLIESLCNNLLTGGKDGRDVKLGKILTKPRTISFDGQNEQTSIRIGRRTITRSHEDFNSLQYTCNILGGYFGSRLSSNIREKQGLTYSIYCVLDNQVYDGDMIISTEVANENVRKVVDEVHKEMDQLCKEYVNKEELTMLNNYMMGNYLNSFDGPFNSIRTIKSLALTDIPLDDINGLIKSTLSFDAYQIRDMAIKYFDRNDFWNVFVGIPNSGY